MTGFGAYIHFRPDGRVFYVGKGRETRALNLRPGTRSRHHACVVAKDGAENIVVSFIPCESEQAAFALEVAMISRFRKMGEPLVNHTNGGEGVSGLVFSDESRTKMKASSAERWADPEVRKAHGAKALGHKMSEECKEKHRISSTGRRHSQQSKDKMSAVQTGRIVSLQCREKLREANLGKKQTEASKLKRKVALQGRAFSDEHRAKLSLAMQGNKGRLGMTTSDETKAKQSIAAKARAARIKAEKNL